MLDELKVVLAAWWNLLRRPGILVPCTAMAMLLLWGLHGKVDLLKELDPGWYGLDKAHFGARSVFIPGLAWDQELISFLIGAVLLIVGPCLLILLMGQKLSDYGLGLPVAGQRMFAVVYTLLLLIFALVSGYLGAGLESMRRIYPFVPTFSSVGQFAQWEATYFLFFLIIEFIFRGFLLFGLAQLFTATHRLPVEHYDEAVGPAFVLSMLSYCAWHIGKPFPEAVGTLVWGFLTGYPVLRMRSIWPVVVVHWLMNVVMDYRIWTT